MKVDLDGKTAVVTGAARGIGKAIADLLADNGARVAYTDIAVEAVKQAALHSNGALAMEMNIIDEQQVSSAVASIVKQFGRIDILINNAGVNTADYRVNVDAFPLDEWDRIVRTDLTGTYLVTRAVSRAMIAQRGGRIVNIASVLGVVPARLQCAFVAAKAGVVQLTRATAMELAQHQITVNCVAPGSTLTEGTRALFYSDSASDKERAERMLRHVPLGRPARVEEIAHAVMFFTAPESSYITGQTLCVDGGWTAGGFLRDF